MVRRIPPTIGASSNGGGAAASVSVAENTTTVTTVTSTDVDGGSPVYSILAGGDGAKFSIDSTTGALAFLAAPNFEAPTDANADNVYELTVQATDGSLTDTQAISVTVSNVSPTVISTTGTATVSANNPYTLNLSVKTVSTYRSRLLEKLEVASNAELAAYALRHGLMVA